MGYWLPVNETSRGQYGLTTTGEYPFCYPCPDHVDCIAGETARTKITEHFCGEVMICPHVIRVLIKMRSQHQEVVKF